MTMPIMDKEGGNNVQGVMMVSISMDEINASVAVLEQKQIFMIGIITVMVLILGYILAGILVTKIKLKK